MKQIGTEKMTTTEDYFNRFSPHSPKSFGEYREGQPTPARTVKVMCGLPQVEAHLRGEVGLGLVPLNGDRCQWAVIDIDNHDGDGEDLDLATLAIQFSDYPGTVVTRSKSGGAHIYFFFKKEIAGKEARNIVHQVAMATGHAGDEIFPKQNQIRTDGWGNWINLPYFGGANTNRYGITDEGQKMSLETFLALPRVAPAELEQAIENSSIGAPPCIEHLLREPPAQGHRNMALFSLAVFFKRSSPETWQDKTTEYAMSKMDPPLAAQETKTVIRSVARSDYAYRCGEAPLTDLCDKKKCLMARHGLTNEQQSTIGEAVETKSLVKYLTEPPLWDLNTELGPVRLSTKALLSHSMIREAIAERYLKIVPKLKADEWHSILSDLMASAKIIDMPKDATSSGLVWSALADYSAAAYSDGGGAEETEDDLERKWDGGLPIRLNGNIYFAGAKFIAWLRRAKRAEGFSPSAIYMALKQEQVEQARIRLNGKVKRSWAFPVEKLQASYPVYKTEEEDF